MSNEHRPEQPLVSIGSHNRINHSVVVVAIVPIFAIVIFLFIAAWPFLSQIGLMLYWLAITCGICVGVLAASGCIFLIHMMREHFLAKKTEREIQSRMIAYGDVVAWLDDQGQLYHLSAQHEAARLPAPRMIEVAEQKRGDTEEIERSKVLTLRQQGMGLHAIEKELGVPYNRVRDYCNAMEELQSKARQRNQMDA